MQSKQVRILFIVCKIFHLEDSSELSTNSTSIIADENSLNFILEVLETNLQYAHCAAHTYSGKLKLASHELFIGS